MPLLDDTEELTQGSTYNPTTTETSGESQEHSGKDKVVMKSTAAVAKEKQTQSKLNLDGKSKAIISIIVVILIIIVSYFGYEFYKDYQTKKELERLEQIENEVQEVFKYSEQDLQAIRNLGYSADEIKNFEILEYSVEQIEKEYSEDVKARFDLEIAPYLDGKSEKYKQLEDLTWLGGKDIDLSNLDENNFHYYTGSYNCDYVKIPPKGSQLFIKATTEKGTDIFVDIDPLRYVELAPSGNIVIEVSYVRVNENTTIILDAREYRIGE